MANLKSAITSMAFLMFMSAQNFLGAEMELGGMILPQISIGNKASEYEKVYIPNNVEYIQNPETGKTTSVGMYPFEVKIGVIPEDYRPSCDGTLIAPNLVLTTALCVTDRLYNPIDKKNLYVYAAEYSFRNETPKAYWISKVIPHPEFSYANRTNNIALLILTEDYPIYKDYPIGILDTEISDDLKVEAPVIEYFKFTDSDATFVSRNYQIIDIHSSSKCQNANPNWLGNNSSTICALEKENRQMCQGNFCGPLVTYTRTGPPKLVGLLTWVAYIHPENSTKGSEVESILYYTNVSYYSKWIKDQMANV